MRGNCGLRIVDCGLKKSCARVRLFRNPQSAIRIRKSMALWMSLVAAAVRGQGHELPDLRPAHGELSPTFWQVHGWQILIAAVLLALVIALVVICFLRPKRITPESPAVVARRDLEKWLARKEDGALIADVTRVLKHYVISAFQFPRGELTTTEFRNALQSSQEIKPVLAAATDDFLRRCDEWKFSATPPSSQSGVVKSALELVDKFEAVRAPSAESAISNPQSAIPG